MAEKKLGLFETRRLCVDDPVRYFERVKGEKLQFARTGMSIAAMTSDPEVIQHVLLKNAQNYRKTLMTRLLLEPALGKETVFTSEGELWRQQRKLAAPAFSLKTIKGFAPLMVEEAQELLARWDRIPPGQRTSGCAIADVHSNDEDHHARHVFHAKRRSGCSGDFGSGSFHDPVSAAADRLPRRA